MDQTFDQPFPLDPSGLVAFPVSADIRAQQESFASGVDVLFEFGVVQHIPWTWVSSVNGVPVLEKVPVGPGSGTSRLTVFGDARC